MIKYRKSIMTDSFDECYLCHRPAECVHHVLGGHGRRAISERHGFLIALCNDCHNMSANSVHRNKNLDLLVKASCQAIFERTHSHDEWINLGGKDYVFKLKERGYQGNK